MSFNKTNNRRIYLIKKKKLRKDEKLELKKLQFEIDNYLSKKFPLPTKPLDELEKRLTRKEK